MQSLGTSSYAGRIAALSILVGLLLGCVGTEAQEPLRSDDPRLAKPLALRIYYDTLEATVSAISADSGVKLTADDAVKPLAVCAVANSATTRQAMDLLASTCGLTWKRTGQAPDYSYHLQRDLKGRNAMAARRKAHWDQAARELESQVEAIVRFGSRFERMEAQVVRKELQELRDTVDTLPTGKERLLAEQSLLCASIAASPTEWPLVVAYQALPGDARARLMHGERVVMATAIRGAVPMPEQVRAALASAQASLAQRERTPAVVNPRATEILEFRAELTDRLVLYARAPRYGNQQRAPRLALPIRQLTPSYAEFTVPALDRSGRVSADNPADLQKLTGFRLLPHKRTRDDVLTYTQGLTPAEIVRSWHEREPGIKVIGASPWTALTYTPGPAPQSAREVLSRLGTGIPLPLGRVLAEIAQRGRLDIHLRGDGWITLQSTTPYNWLHESIDPRWIVQTYGNIAEGKALYSVTAAKHAARGLTYLQARTLADFELGFLADKVPPGEMDRNYAFWRLASELPERDSDELIKGKPLRYSTLTRSGKQAFAAFLGTISREDGPMDLELSPTTLSGLELTCQPSALPIPTDPSAVARGTHRIVELRLVRPEVTLLKRLVCCNWE